MEIKVFIRELVNNFFVIYSCIMLGHIILWRTIWGNDMVSSYGLTAIFVMSILYSLAGIVLYSKRDMKRLELLIRHALHLFLIVTIYLSLGSYLGWVQWDRPTYLIGTAGLIIGVYIATLATRFYQSKEETDEMNEMLKEINKE